LLAELSRRSDAADRRKIAGAGGHPSKTVFSPGCFPIGGERRADAVWAAGSVPPGLGATAAFSRVTALVADADRRRCECDGGRCALASGASAQADLKARAVASLCKELADFRRTSERTP
jgi:hypothetical protein